MKKITTSFLLLFSILFNNNMYSQLKYPLTKQIVQQDDYFGTLVSDPFRWLEDDNSEATKNWVVAQNEVTQKYLQQIPFREQVKSKIESMWNYVKYSSPFKQGDCYYFYKNDGLQNQSVLYRQLGMNGTPEIFLDPNTMSKDGTAAPGIPSFNKSSKYCAYLLSQSGSDWQQIFVMDVASKKILTDQVQWVKFSGISWKGEEGFYYSRYPKTDSKNLLSQKNELHALYFHKIGTDQSEDVLIYDDQQHPLRTITGGLTEDESFLVVNVSEGTSGAELWVKNLKKNTPFTLLFKGFDHEADVIDNKANRLLVKTNLNASNYRLVSIDPENPAVENWIEVVKEQNKLLETVQSAGGKLMLTYLENACSKVYQYDYDGHLQRMIELPGIGTASGFGGKKDDNEIFYTFSSFNVPPTIYQYTIATGDSKLFRQPSLSFKPEAYITEQKFCKSKDGTLVPMFITYKKGMILNGNNPTLIYGYGGFNIPLTPAFSISNAFFLEQGGIYVQMNLRGGNEYGEDWHKGGMLMNKQHVFDDAIATAEYLIQNKYTNSSKLAIRGGSNGGLLVGACITQRPELFKVAIPQVGVLDMLRYHMFTIGWAWAVEYGKSDNKDDFKNLYAYSPLHNLKKGVQYPATLITTADHDDRVVPAHSFKFAAQLQLCNEGTNPTLIRIDAKAGHGAGKPTGKMIEEAADIWSFVMYNLGMQIK